MSIRHHDGPGDNRYMLCPQVCLRTEDFLWCRAAMQRHMMPCLRHNGLAPDVSCFPHAETHLHAPCSYAEREETLDLGSIVDLRLQPQNPPCRAGILQHVPPLAADQRQVTRPGAHGTAVVELVNINAAASGHAHGGFDVLAQAGHHGGHACLLSKSIQRSRPAPRPELLRNDCSSRQHGRPTESASRCAADCRAELSLHALSSRPSKAAVPIRTLNIAQQSIAAKPHHQCSVRPTIATPYTLHLCATVSAARIRSSRAVCLGCCTSCSGQAARQQQLIHNAHKHAICLEAQLKIGPGSRQLRHAAHALRRPSALLRRGIACAAAVHAHASLGEPLSDAELCQG